jgi:hypothetical protein
MVSEISSTEKPQVETRARLRALDTPRLLFWTLVAGLFLLGLAVRMVDLTDQPLDFHPTRQLRSAIIARGMYYQMLPGADQQLRDLTFSHWESTGQYEPSILERIVALTYLAMGGENVWVARIYNSLFWLIGAAAVFALARRMTSNAGGALALGYYLLLPFGVQASRSFQPDPGMVMWIALTTYTLYRWSEKQEWKWALWAGVLGGMAVVTKVVAAYIIAGAAIAMVLYALGVKKALKSRQVWSMVALMIAPTAIFYLGRGARASEYFSSWTLSLSHLLLEPATYARWLSLVESLMGWAVLLLALVGVLIARPRNRTLLLGLWVGYAVYGLFLPYQMYTHNYYHLQLIPIIALSLAVIGQDIAARFSEQGRLWQGLVMVVMVGALGYTSWLSIFPQIRDDYRHEPAYWAEIGSFLPDDGKILALTQDYGYRIMYYGWRKVVMWPTRGEKRLAELRGKEKEFDDYFQKRIEDKKYFLITAFNQFDDQPVLKETLHERYPIYAQGPGYLIFDLQHPLPRQ